jgi:hypothetical protein
MIYKTLDRKLKIEQHKPTKNWVNSGAPEGLVVPAPHMIPFVFMFNATTII